MNIISTQRGKLNTLKTKLHSKNKCVLTRSNIKLRHFHGNILVQKRRKEVLELRRKDDTFQA